MRIELTALIIVLGVAATFAGDRTCQKCGQDVLANDAFCARCGADLVERYTVGIHGTNQDYVSPPSCGFSAVDRLKGMGRGLVTAMFSPMSLFRGMGWGCGVVQEGTNKGGDSNNPITATLGMLMVYPGAALGSFAACADAVNGSLDMISLGYYGDWLYYPVESHSPTPWFWERDWYDLGEWPEFPWITR